MGKDYLGYPSMEADAADDVVLAGSAVWARDRGGAWLQADPGDPGTWRSDVSVLADGRAVAAYHLLDGTTNVVRVVGTTDRRDWTVLADISMPEDTEGIVDLVVELTPAGDVWVSVKPVHPPGLPDDERIVWLEAALTP